METALIDPLIHLNETERACVQRYLDTLEQRLAENLIAVWLFGSFARGDMWGKHWPMNSDLDLLILSKYSITDQDREELINETYPLYLEGGRQISPQFRTVAEFQKPNTERGRAFKARLAEEGRLILSSPAYKPETDH